MVTKHILTFSLLVSSLLGIADVQAAFTRGSPINVQKFTINSEARHSHPKVKCPSCLQTKRKDNTFYSYYLKPDANEQGEIPLTYVVNKANSFACAYKTKIPFTLDTSGNFIFNPGKTYESIWDPGTGKCEPKGPVTTVSNEGDTIVLRSTNH